jgi:hypothetical protein
MQHTRWIREYIEWHEELWPTRTKHVFSSKSKEISEDTIARERCEKRYDNSTPINMIDGLSTRAKNCIKNMASEYEFTTVGELRKVPDGCMLRSPNFGRKSLKELYNADVLWAGRETSDDKRFQWWPSPSPYELPEVWDRYKSAIAHWNVYGTWPNGSTDPSDVNLYKKNL